MPTPTEAVLAAPLDHLADPNPAIRRLAVSLLTPGVADPGVAERLIDLLDDGDSAVRAAAAEALGGLSRGSPVPETVTWALEVALADDDGLVVEAAVTALGELAPQPGLVDRLVEIATDEALDKLVRESAVAALGAVGDPTAVPVLLELLATGPPQVRRRAVVALTVFDDPAIEPALRRATSDRNPMVRDLAQMVVGPK